jgi:integrase
MALTVLRVKAAKPGEKLSDGDGLRLDVDARGGRSWVFRFKSPTTGKERYMGLGPASDVSLAAARDAAQAARALIRQSIDPIEHRVARRAAAKAEASRSVTFRTYAEGYITRMESGWKNEKHRQQWTNSLKTYAFPLIGETPIADIDTAAVMSVLTPIWNSKPETASRVRGRLEMILTAAKAEGLRTGDNPAAWRERIKPLLPSKRKVRAVVHHRALPYSLLPKFMASLYGDQSDSVLLLRFIIATVARYNEGGFADWSEIDDEQKLWAIPGARMKGDRPDKPHVVPLTDAAMNVLNLARERSGGKGLIFPGMRRGQTHQRRGVSKGDCAPHRPKGNDARLPLDVSGLGWRHDEFPARGVRAGSCARYCGRNGGGLSSVGRIGKTAIVDERMGCVLYV